MSRTFDLAIKGMGKVSPNPLVGCVIVHDGRIIGEGWHQEFGGPHAEVEAVNSAKDKDLLAGSTVYVNLEPCSFQGKTPPCADLLVQSKVKKVVISTVDPNPLVQGKGIQHLRRNNIEVVEGVLQERGLELNRRFFTNQIKNRPYVILKWAETQDGFIAREDFSSKWISSSESRKIVHKWRAEEDAVLVGRNTAFYDNPQLDVRDWSGPNPIRIVLDPDNSLPENLHVKDGSTETLIYNHKKQFEQDRLTYIEIQDDRNFLHAVLSDLISRGIGSIIIEGGSKVIQSFVENELWDEARVFRSKNKFHKGIPAPKMKLDPLEIIEISTDTLHYYRKL